MKELLRLDYRAHEAFIDAARPKAEIWRLLFGIVLVLALFVFFSELLLNFLLSFMTSDVQDAFLDDLFTGTTAGAVLFILLQISLLIPAVAFTVFGLHKRNAFTLLGDRSLFVQQFVLVMALQIGLILLIAVLPPYSFDGAPIERNMSFLPWLVFLPVGLLVVFLQCAAEEVAFRGYLQQQLAARFNHPLVWMVLPSALFALGHYMPEEAGENAVPIALLAGVYGLAMADITARAGTLGPAIAMHIANNFSAVLLAAPKDDMSGLALYMLPISLSDSEIVGQLIWIDLAATFVSWLAARLVIQR